MKKTLAILLALVAIGGFVFAEDAAPAVKTAISVWGEDGVYNNGTDTYLGGNNGIDLDFDASTAKMGVSIEAEVIADGTAAPADQYLNYAYGWYKPADFVKIDAGQIAIYDYRLRNSMSQTMMGYALGENAGLAVEVFPVEGLSLAAFLPAAQDKSFATGVPGYTVLFEDGIVGADLFAKYAMKDVGTFYAATTMASGNTLVNGGADLTLVPNAKIQLGVNYGGIGQSGAVGQDLSVYTVLGYKLDALTLTQETNLYSNTADPEVKAFGWLSNSIVAYRVGDVRLQGTVNVKNARMTTKDYLVYSAEAAARFYDGSNYFNVAFKYSDNSDHTQGGKATWKIPVAYSIAF